MKEARRHEGTEARRHDEQGTKARRHEGAGARHEGTKAQRHGGEARLRPFGPSRLALAPSCLVAILAFVAGCPVTADLPSNGEIRDSRVRETGAKYYLFVPSHYTDRRSWPLVVLCHGTNPYDSAWAQMREWAKFAEDHDIIVAAPELNGVRGDFPPPPHKQLALQRQDEQTILGVVRALKASHRIADEAVFMAGWSAGGYDVLYAGLRNPHIFRALAVRQGNFDERYLEDVAGRLDRSQRILVYWGTSDPVRPQSEASVKWLRDHGMYVDTESKPGIHRRLPVSIAWDYFKDIYRNTPWIRAMAIIADPASPRSVQFRLRAVPPARAARWEFGDGQTADGLTPRHEYEIAGQYDVTVKVQLENKKWYKRTLTVRAGGATPVAPPIEGSETK